MIEQGKSNQDVSGYEEEVNQEDAKREEKKTI